VYGDADRHHGRPADVGHHQLQRARGVCHRRFTAIFFGLCAATFLPAYIGGLFWRRVTRTGALASMTVGMGVSLFWLLLSRQGGGRHPACATGHGRQTSLLADYPNWPMVDPIVIALPLAVLTLVLVSAFTKPADARHLDLCFAQDLSNESRTS